MKHHGAKGIVLDSQIRDFCGSVVIPDTSARARDTVPIESAKRWRIRCAYPVVAMPGTLTSQVGVAPRAWVIVKVDGVIVVPREIATEALVKAEDIEAQEKGMRVDLASGMPFESYHK